MKQQQRKRKETETVTIVLIILFLFPFLPSLDTTTKKEKELNMNCAENDFVNGNKGHLKTACETKNAMEKINNRYALIAVQRQTL